MNGKIQPENWLSKLAIDCFDQISTIKNKVKSRDCLPKGLYPVIDQGQIFISGYINDKSKLIKVDTPICIFGDHTRIVKWVTYDFVPGADGTKLLQPKAFIHPRYAYYSLCALNIPDKGYSRHFKYFKELEINLPGWVEQKIIAEKLDTLLAQVDTTKARLEQVPQILKRFRQAVLAAAVGGKLTEEWRGTATLNDWKKGILKNFIKKPSYGTSAKSQKEGLIPVLRMGNLQSGKLDWSDLVYTSDRNEIEKYKLIAGDILFNRTNSPELVGKTSIFRGEREAIYAGYLIKIQCLDGLNSEYLNYHLNSHIAKQYCYEVKSDGVSQSNINAQKLAAYPLEVPPIEEQAEIVRRVEQLFVYADTIEKQVNNALSRVNNLTQSILAKAFRGELTAQWRVENPDLISGENSAAALLEKIKAERAASGNKKASRKKK
ncbi:TPA: restriction endonuclease subunit S [Proteus mirabilis]|nr:restriction endonuclease subunit S [Proteus mirabilis]HCD1103432.1 restriction endonuclease subunit S [Proteus mirabilis]HCD1125184.1 restriction endonuclease subunit S [Proteus mirabilis]